MSDYINIYFATLSFSDTLNSKSIPEIIKLKYKVSMPKDFYDFYDFAKSINPKNPCGISVE